MIMKNIFLGLLIIPMYLGYQRVRIMNAKTEKENFYKYDGLFKFYALQKGINWKWLKAIAKQESDLGEDRRVKSGSTSGDGLSYGIMQIAEGVGSPKEIELKGFGGKEKLNDPAYSIKVAAKLVGYLNKKYNGDANKVFLAYNQGEKNTDKGANYTLSYAKKINKWLEWIDQKDKEFKNASDY